MKPENLLLDKKMNIKVADFGMASLQVNYNLVIIIFLYYACTAYVLLCFLTSGLFVLFIVTRLEIMPCLKQAVGMDIMRNYCFLNTSLLQLPLMVYNDRSLKCFPQVSTLRLSRSYSSTYQSVKQLS